MVIKLWPHDVSVNKSWNYENSVTIVLNWNVLGSCSWRSYWRDGNLMVMKLQACNIVVTLSFSKSWNDQKVPINYITSMLCVSTTSAYHIL